MRCLEPGQKVRFVGRPGDVLAAERIGCLSKSTAAQVLNLARAICVSARFEGRDVEPIAMPREVLSHQIDEESHLARQLVSMWVNGVDREFYGSLSWKDLTQTSGLDIICNLEAEHQAYALTAARHFQ